MFGAEYAGLLAKAAEVAVQAAARRTQSGARLTASGKCDSAPALAIAAAIAAPGIPGGSHCRRIRAVM